MPQYQLQVAAGLDVLALTSILLLILNRTKEGKIRLSDLDAADPFDVTTPEDLVEGFPIQEDHFWKQVKRRKVVMAVLASLLLAAQVWGGVDARFDVVSILRVSFAVYILLIAVIAIRRQSVADHSEAIWHLSALNVFAVPVLGFAALLPDEELQTSVVEYASWCYYAALALHTLIALVAVGTPCGPALHYAPSDIYSEKVAQAITNREEENVAGVYGASPWSIIFFSYSTRVVMLGATASSLEIGDLPILTVNMRASHLYDSMRSVLRSARLRVFSWTPPVGSGMTLIYQLLYINRRDLTAIIFLSLVSGVLFYLPFIFMSRILAYLENDPEREHLRWGYVWVLGLLGANLTLFMVTGQTWSLSAATLQAQIKNQLNTVLFAKTLVRKDIPSGASSSATTGESPSEADADAPAAEFSSKAQIMTLMTTDVDRVARLTHYLFAIVDVPVEIFVGTTFLYRMLGVSCFFGLGVAVLCLPLNHFAGHAVAGAQDQLMKARDERVAVMNEVLGGIRMLKFMAWERSFEARILKIRTAELKHQRLQYIIECFIQGFWNGIPVIITLVSFYHFAVVRGEALKPSIAFSSIIVFNELRLALGLLTDTFISIVQSYVSLRRIEKYLDTREIALVPPLAGQSSAREMAFRSCTVTWPQDRAGAASSTATPLTPRHKFVLVDLSLEFPRGELSVVCGRLGAGKTLLLLALLGEADVLAGQVVCPRSPANILASFKDFDPTKEDWVVDGVCAYVPQTAWLQNASIKENILFNLPYDEKRYIATLEACALVSDFEILEDGDQSEIGERGVNLSGGQKARVSLARAVYSRASVLFLDDVLSAVDAHTAHHLYHSCLRGPLMLGRTVILVSHHVQLTAPDAAYIVALDNGRVQFSGGYDAFQASGVMAGLVQSIGADHDEDEADAKAEQAIEEAELDGQTDVDSPGTGATTPATAAAKAATERKAPRKYIEEEQRAVGHVAWDVWKRYIAACGGVPFWSLFLAAFVSATLARVAENWWLGLWSSGEGTQSPVFYLSIYSGLAWLGVLLIVVRQLVLYFGAIHASKGIHKSLLESVLFAQIRFHDTVSRGRVLNRFGKDIEGLDSTLPGNLGRVVQGVISSALTLTTMSFIGGWPFVLAIAIILTAYYQIGKIYGQACRDLRRLDSITRSPLYSMYSETIAGVAIIRAFGASSKFLREMLRNVDTNCNPAYWTWGTNRWLAIRMMSLASLISATMALLAVIDKNISAATAGFALSFANSVLYDLFFVVREFVSLEQAMVGLERVKEYSELKREPPEFIEPRPDKAWPQEGVVKCENLIIRYAPDLPDVLHELNFEINAGEKVGVLGRTGSGKSTLALSFFRFVEPTAGRILVDGVDISQIGLTDLRGRLTIIPQDPTILSGTLRGTLDVFGEYEDKDIFEALRRVHLIPSGVVETVTPGEDVNTNVFRDLDSVVAEGGDNFSTGEKQLLCMARAILKRSKVLLMDEATASVDYATDALIGNTIRQEFKDSTIITIAHRLRTVIDYDKILLLEQGRIVEFDKPAVLLADSSSKFHALCKATGKKEFKMLKQLAGL
ncbi:Multidrug resistance-associated ABC transporter protein [Mycena kentingensis (nom. inval.)]|nr:Multidrug resistance-associated ABC transporter protein [Mycena kentingensis (nom. inval.)]